jgi:hypothetical protein
MAHLPVSPRKRLHRRRLRVLVLQQLLHQRAARERRLARQQEVQRAAQAVDVAADVHAVGVAGLLGREVVRGADDGLDRVVRFKAAAGRPQTGQAPVEDDDATGGPGRRQGQ